MFNQVWNITHNIIINLWSVLNYTDLLVPCSVETSVYLLLSIYMYSEYNAIGGERE